MILIVLIDPDDLVVLNNSNTYKIQDIDFNIKSQAYTTDQFGIRVSQAINTLMTQGIEGTQLTKGDGSNLIIGLSDVVMSFPYQYIYDREPFYMGFAGKPYTPPKLTDSTFPTTLYSAITNFQFFAVELNDNIIPILYSYFV